MPKYDISVFLIKQGTNEFVEALKEDEELEPFDIKDRFNIDGIVYLGSNETRSPKWNELLSQGVIDYEVQSTMSTRAVLFIERRERIFAFTFGYGRYLLKNDSYVRGFGRRVILNNALDGSLKSVDTSIFDETPINSTLQTSKSVLLSEFNITDIRTMFRSVTAESINKRRYGSIIAGKDSFNFQYKLNFNNIKNICDYLLDDYQDNSYKKRFSEVERMEEVSDPEKIDELNSILIQQLHNNEIDQFYIPELVDWEKIDGFSFTPKGENDIDLSLDRFRKEKKEFDERLKVQYLKNHRIYCNFIEEVNTISWSAYDCLHTEVQEDDAVYIFSIGKWFKVENDFVEEVNNFIENINECPLVFPEVDGEHEQEVNKIIEQKLPNLLNLDRDTTSISGSQYEICDLLSTCRRFIHVKWWDSSATLSHLFSQGSVSGDILLNSYHQRSNVHRKIFNQDEEFASVINARNYRPEDYTIVFAIIYPETNTIAERLPFFSKANLKQNVSLIRNMGYNVELGHIQSSRNRIKKSEQQSMEGLH